MQIEILTIGKLKKDSSEKQLIDYYQKLIRWNVFIREFEIKKKVMGEELKKAESTLLLENSFKDSYRIVLDERGEMLTSTSLSAKINKIRENYSYLSFFIGGAMGHASFLKEKADCLLSLSPLTFPHFMVRPILLEQIYRSQTIIEGHPYHKD